MKSIKEKAEEVFPIEEYYSLETKLQRRKMRLCYEHGANYVLDHLSMTISVSEDGYLRDNLRKMIEQLKR